MIDYYHRRHEDGSSETICTRCFETLGCGRDPGQLKHLEALHICGSRSGRLGVKNSKAPTNRNRGIARSELSAATLDHRLWQFLGELSWAHTLLLLLGTAVCCYLLPTVIEFELLRHLDVWFSCIFFGDLVGCSLLSAVLGLRKTGGLLYAALGSGEAWLYEAHVLRPPALVWLADLVPTLAISGLILFFFFRSRRMLSAPSSITAA